MTPSISSLLHSCKSLRTLKQIHALIIRRHSDQDAVIIARFLVLCNSLSSLPYAVAVFSRVRTPKLILLNILLKAHCDHRSPLSRSLSLFNLMRKSPPLRPDGFTFPSLLKAASFESNLSVGSSLHSCIVISGLGSDGYVQTALIDFYGKCSSACDARKVFDAMSERNEVSWTAMVSGYLSCGDFEGARMLFEEMPKRNVVTFNAMIDGFVKRRDMANARALFDEMPEKNSVTFTSMIDGFAKVGDVASARWFFEKGEDCRDLFSWSAMISGYVQNGFPGAALKLFLELIEQKVEPDEHVVVGLISACSQFSSLSLVRWVDSYIARSRIDWRKTHISAALIDMNAKCGNMKRAAFLFELVGKRDLISYCSMMKGYSIHGLGVKSVELFCRMIKEGILPDSAAFTVVLNACSHAGLVEEGKHYFELMKNKYFIVPSMDHYACMVDLLGRAGMLKEAYELIQTMPMDPHAGVLGALLGACGLHGDIELGELVAKRLFEIEPDNAGNFVLLSNIYAAVERWADVSRLRTMMRLRGVKKVQGCTRI